MGLTKKVFLIKISTGLLLFSFSCKSPSKQESEILTSSPNKENANFYETFIAEKVAALNAENAAQGVNQVFSLQEKSVQFDLEGNFVYLYFHLLCQTGVSPLAWRKTLEALPSWAFKAKAGGHLTDGISHLS